MGGIPYIAAFRRIFARFQENQTIRSFLTESTVTTVLNLLMVFIYFSILFLYSAKMTLMITPKANAPRSTVGVRTGIIVIPPAMIARFSIGR